MKHAPPFTVFPSWSQVFSLVALSGLCASAALHVASFLSRRWSEVPLGTMFVLGIGVFALCTPLIVTERASTQQEDYWKRFLGRLPLWLRFVAVGLAVYTVFNFARFFALTEGGTLHIREGSYFLEDHGRVIRELTEQGYRDQIAYQVRFFSGHLLPFYFFATVSFWLRSKSERAK